MASPGSIVMQAHHLVADGALCVQGVKSSSSEDLDELENPYGEAGHGRLIVALNESYRSEHASQK